MTESSGATTAGEDRIADAGLRRFHRLFDVIVGVFGLLFVLQTADSFIADLPAMSNPVGYAVIALVGLSVAAGLVPAIVRGRGRAAFLTGAGLFAAALVLWPLSVDTSIPTDPMPWLVAVWPVPVAYAAQAATARAATITGAIVLSTYTGIALQFGGGLGAADAAVNSLFMTGIAIVLVLLLGVVRHGIAAAGAAQQAALVGFAATRVDEATEAERKRTDALLHDAVLTTFLSAADARNVESHQLARRMSANALRVLMHVNGVGRGESMVPFGQAFAEERARLGSELLRVDVDLGAAESVMLPVEVASAIMAVLSQALTAGVDHRRGARRTTLRAAPLGADGIRVHLDGCRIDAETYDSSGLRSDDAVVRDIRAFEGRVDVDLAEGRSRVTVSWGSIVMVGTTPLLEEHDPLLSSDRLALS